MKKEIVIKILSFIAGCIVVGWIYHHQTSKGLPLFIDKHERGGEIGFFWLIAAGLIAWPFWGKINYLFIWLLPKVDNKEEEK